MNSNSTKYTPLGPDAALAISRSTTSAPVTRERPVPISRMRMTNAPVAADGASWVRPPVRPSVRSASIGPQMERTPENLMAQSYHVEREQFLRNPVVRAVAPVQRAVSGVLNVPLLGYKNDLAGAVNPFRTAQDYEETDALWEVAGGAIGDIVDVAATLAGGVTLGAAENALATALGGGRLMTGLTQAATGAVTGAAAKAETGDQRLLNTVAGGVLGGATGAAFPSRNVPRLTDELEVAAREGIEDPTHPSLLRRLFTYEAGMDRFPGTHTHVDPRWTFADDVYEFTSRAGRAHSRSLARTRSVLVQMAGEGGHIPDDLYGNFRTVFNAWKKAITASHTGAKDASDYVRVFRDLEAAAEPSVRHAFQQHRRNVRWAALNEIANGNSQTLSQFLSRGLGALPEKAAAFGPRNTRLMFAYNMRAARQELYETAIETNGRGILDLPEPIQTRLKRGDDVMVDGLPHRLVDLSAMRRYDAIAWERAFGAARDAVALPVHIVERLGKLGVRHEPPKWFQAGVQAPTRWFKQAAIFHGISRFLVRNILGDATAAVRSFPGLFLTPTGVMAMSESIADTAVRLGARLQSKLADRGLVAPMEESEGFLNVMARYFEAADRNVTGSEFFSGEMKLGQLAEEISGSPRPLSPTDVVWNTLRSTMTGQAHRGSLLRMPLEVKDVVLRESEGLLRSASYYYQLRRGVPPGLAAKRTREAFVDYARFTEFEDNYLRNFALPFYSFARQTIPNWMKAATGNDVAAATTGDRVASAVSAWTQMAALPVAAMMWNEKFFPEIEDNLSPEKRSEFHIIMGNPLTGEVQRDDRGRPMLFGLDMPQDLVAELLGMGSWGALASNAFGLGVDGDGSLLARWQRVEEWRTAPQATKGVFEGAASLLRQHLSPGITVPYMWLTGEDLAYGTLVSPDRQIDWSVRKLLPPVGTLRRTGALGGLGYSEDAKTFEDRHREPYRFMTDPVGGGLPISIVNRDAQMRWRLIAMLQFATDGREDPLVRRVLGTMRGLRGDNPHVPAPMEEDQIQRLAAEAESPQAAEQLLRMHARIDGRARSTTMERMWGSMNVEQRERFIRIANPQDLVALLFFAHGGDNFFED